MDLYIYLYGLLALVPNHHVKPDTIEVALLTTVDNTPAADKFCGLHKHVPFFAFKPINGDDDCGPPCIKRKEFIQGGRARLSEGPKLCYCSLEGVDLVFDGLEALKPLDESPDVIPHFPKKIDTTNQSSAGWIVRLSDILSLYSQAKKGHLQITRVASPPESPYRSPRCGPACSPTTRKYKGASLPSRPIRRNFATSVRTRATA